MPWCVCWGTGGGSYWWVLPLIGLLFMGVVFFTCFRGPGCMARRRRTPGEPSDLRREVETLKDDMRKLQRQPG